MGEHETWLNLLPGFTNTEKALAHALGPSWLAGSEVHGLPHVFMALIVVLFVLFLAARYRKGVAASGDGGVVPESRFGARSVVEIVGEAVIGMMAGVMGEKAARTFFPLIGTLAFFILFSNLFGLLPGLLPATDNLNTTAAAAVIIFVTTHLYGLREHGAAYLKHFMGPIPVLAPLMLPIELISHFVRPLSLSMRLMGNMVGDHAVLGIFLVLVPLLVPVPILALGFIVCVVQTLVFCLLSVVYIGLAIEHHEEHH